MMKKKAMIIILMMMEECGCKVGSDIAGIVDVDDDEEE
jgi:hypothetical protein